MPRLLKRQEGMALVLVAVMMLVLSLMAVWLVGQGTTRQKIARAIGTYESTFNLADGACQVSLSYLVDHNPDSASWNPGVQGRAAGLPSYMDSGIQFADRPFTPQIRADIDWKGYDSTPLPGWMINWQGYSAFHRIHYKAKGEGRVDQRGGRTRVGALVVKLAR